MKKLTELEKRRTLDLSAQVIAVHDDYDNDNDDGQDDVGFWVKMAME